ncbi:MAG: hypothetical protein ACRC9P_10615 [Bacteroides sp.]
MNENDLVLKSFEWFMYGFPNGPVFEEICKISESVEGVCLVPDRRLIWS